MDGILDSDPNRDIAAENYHTATESEQSSAFQSCESLDVADESNNNTLKLNGDDQLDGEMDNTSTDSNNNDPNKIVDIDTASTALHLACQDVDVSLVKQLIEKGASVQRTNAKDRTMIHELVIGYCSLSMLDRVFEQNNFIEILSLLIKEGVDVNDIDISNKTALLYFITIPKTTERLTEPLKALLMSGARVNIPDGSLQTALHLASQRGDSIMLDTLLEHGADANVRDSLGQNPLHLAVKGRRHKAVIAKLSSVGADLNCQDRGLRTPLHVATKSRRLDNVKELLRQGARANKRDGAGNTCLHLASVHDPSGKLLRHLLEFKDYKNRPIDINLQDFVYEETVLHKIVRLKMVENFKILCSYGPNPNVKDVTGETPLHKASHITDILFWDALIKLGGDINIPSHSGITPYQKAAKAKNHVALAVMKQCNLGY